MNEPLSLIVASPAARAVLVAVAAVGALAGSQVAAAGRIHPLVIVTVAATTFVVAYLLGRLAPSN